MTAPSTFVLKGTWTEPDASAAVGTLTVWPTDNRFINNANVVTSERTVFTLDGAGKLNGTTGVTLIQATNGYDYELAITGPAGVVRQVQKGHFAGTGNLDISPSHTTMTVTGTFYDPDNTTATGTIRLTDLDVGDVYTLALSSGALSKVVFKNTGGYLVEELIDNRRTVRSYTIPGTASIDLSAA